MPVTLTLPDDMALELSAMLNAAIVNKLARKGQEAEFSEVPAVRVGNLIRAVPKGEQFSSTGLAFQAKLPQPDVSKQLRKAAKSGIVKMICRGTWEKTK